MKRTGLFIGSLLIVAAIALGSIFIASEAVAQSAGNAAILDSVRADMNELQTLLRLYEQGEVLVYGDLSISLTATHRTWIKNRAAALRTSIRAELMELTLD